MHYVNFIQITIPLKIDVLRRKRLNKMIMIICVSYNKLSKPIGLLIISKIKFNIKLLYVLCSEIKSIWKIIESIQLKEYLLSH